MGEVVVKPSPEWVAFGEEIFQSLPDLYQSHAVTNPIYGHLSQVAKSHFDGLDTDRIFAKKVGWLEVQELTDMPANNK